MTGSPEIQVQTLNHLGIIAGIIDEMGLVEEINQQLGQHEREIVSAGHIVKAMILNGLGFVTAPLYLFEQFFEGKATEHLIGEGVLSKHLNDDRLGRVLDQLYLTGLTKLFVSIALKVAVKEGVCVESLHLDSSSFHVHGEYLSNSEELSVVVDKGKGDLSQPQTEPKPIHITYGYSRDNRPDLKQFIIDLICSADGDIPLYLRVADGNESDKAMFAQLIQEFRQQLSLEPLIVADSALYSEDNIQSLGSLKWICRVPLTVAPAKQIVKELTISDLIDTQLPGYKIACRNSQYGGIAQRWVIVESQARKQADIKQLYRTIEQLEKRLNQQMSQLSHQNFRCEADVRLAAERFAKKLKYHVLEGVTVTQQKQHTQPGRPRKDSQPIVTYRLAGSLVRNPTAIQETIASSGRFILATNVINPQDLSDFQVLLEYKQQQAPERGFRFLKDPLFFTSSVCLKSPERVAAMAMVMGLCLLVYSLGQRQLRQALVATKESLKDQLGKATQSPTLRWIFQCFQDLHLFQVAGVKHIANLTPERRWILRFFGRRVRQYYLLC
jgi:transposase